MTALRATCLCHAKIPKQRIFDRAYRETVTWIIFAKATAAGRSYATPWPSLSRKCFISARPAAMECESIVTNVRGLLIQLLTTCYRYLRVYIIMYELYASVSMI